MDNPVSLNPSLCVADSTATQLFPVPSVPFISIDSPLKIEAIEDPYYQNADFWVGFVGVLISIILSITSLIYAKKLAKESRDDSINDLFWFREVVYPRSIVPLFDLLDSFSNQIPSWSITKSKRKAVANQCFDDWNEARRNLHYKLAYLGHWNVSIYIDVFDKLEIIEEKVTDYCYKLQSNLITTNSEYDLCIQSLANLQSFLFTEVQKAHLGK